MPWRTIFIGYRRKDTGEVSGRVFDHIALSFGSRVPFKDVESGIPIGVNFVEHIKKKIAECGVFLALIGPKWLENASKRSRLDDPNDIVRLELEAAYRAKVKVVPLLMNGARMPHASDLPESLRWLVHLQAAQLRRDPDFAGDVDFLLRQVAPFLKTATQSVSGSPGEAWRLVANSLVSQRYQEFIDEHPESPEALDALDRLDLLREWNRIDREDPSAIDDFLDEFPVLFPALRQMATEALLLAEEAEHFASRFPAEMTELEDESPFAEECSDASPNDATADELFEFEQPLSEQPTIQREVRIELARLAWAKVESSLDIADYEEFCANHGGFPGISIALRIAQLEAWALLDRNDKSSLEGFLQLRLFPALCAEVQRAISGLTRAEPVAPRSR